MHPALLRMGRKRPTICLAIRQRRSLQCRRRSRPSRREQRRSSEGGQYCSLASSLGLLWLCIVMTFTILPASSPIHPISSLSHRPYCLVFHSLCLHLFPCRMLIPSPTASLLNTYWFPSLTIGSLMSITTRTSSRVPRFPLVSPFRARGSSPSPCVRT